MAREQVAHRIICSEARVDQSSLRAGYLQDDDMKAIVRGVESLYQAPIYVDDTPSMSPLDIRGKTRRLMAEHHGLGLVIIDYLQLMHGQGRFENRNQEISFVARSLKSMAREMKVPVIALSQLSREVERRQPRRPMLSDLRESGSIEQEADVVMLLYRPSYYRWDPDELRRAGYTSEDETAAEINIAKQRNGPTRRVVLSWIDKHARFEERDAVHQSPDTE
jgi:replicative DNA helicase